MWPVAYISEMICTCSVEKFVYYSETLQHASDHAYGCRFNCSERSDTGAAIRWYYSRLISRSENCCEFDLSQLSPRKATIEQLQHNCQKT